MVLNRIQTLQGAGFALHRQRVLAAAYRLSREIGISNNFNDKTEIAGYDCWKSVFS